MKELLLLLFTSKCYVNATFDYKFVDYSNETFQTLTYCNYANEVSFWELHFISNTLLDEVMCYDLCKNWAGETINATTLTKVVHQTHGWTYEIDNSTYAKKEDIIRWNIRRQRSLGCCQLDSYECVLYLPGRILYDPRVTSSVFMINQYFREKSASRQVVYALIVLGSITGILICFGIVYKCHLSREASNKRKIGRERYLYLKSRKSTISQEETLTTQLLVDDLGDNWNTARIGNEFTVENWNSPFMGRKNRLRQYNSEPDLRATIR